MSNQLTVSVLLKLVDQMSSEVRGVLAKSEAHLESFGAKAEKIGQKFESIGLRVGGIGVAGQAGLSRLGLDLNTLTGNAIDAEKALYGIAATAGISGDEARKMVGEWTFAVNQIAVATNQSQERVTAAFNDMIAKGMDPKAAVQMLKPIGQAATAAGADIQDMASAAQASFSKLKIPVEDVAKSIDIMAQAGKSGAFELRDMAGYFDKLTASAANLGISGQAGLASISAAAQIARRGTGDAAQAATNLDNFLGKLNAEVTYKAFDEMGVDLGKLKEEAKASGDYLGYMAQAIQKLTGGDTAKVASLFNDIQAGAFVQGMLRDLNDYKAIRDEALAANGVAAQDFATAMQSASAQVDQFKISASAAVGNGDAMKTMLSSLTGIANWANENPELAKWLIFGTAGLAVGGAAIAGIGAMVPVIGSLSTALAGLGAFLLANPVVLSILGLAAVGVASFKFGSFLAEQIDLALKAVSGNKFASLGSAIYDMVQWFKDLPGKVKAAVTGWYAEFKAIGANIIKGLLDGITAKYDEVIKKIRNLGSDMLREVKDVLGIRSPSKEMELVGENTVLGMLVGMENEAPNLNATATEIGENAMDALQKPFRDNKGRFLPADEAARAATEWARAGDDIEKSLTDALLRGFEGGADWAGNFVDTLKNMFSTLVLRPILQPIAQGAAGAVTGALGMGASGSAFASGGGDILGLGSSLMNAMAPSAISAEIGMMAGGIAEMAGATSAVAGSIGGFVASAIPWVGAIFAVGSMFGLFGGKPSNKSAGGTVDLATGQTGDLWNMTGKKQASQETLDARSALLAGIGGYSTTLNRLGGQSTGSVGVDVGERDGIQFKIDGVLKSYGADANAALVQLFRELAVGADGLSDTLKGLLGNFAGTAEEMSVFAGTLVMLRDYSEANPMQAAAEAAEAAGRSAWQTWQQQGTDLRTALAAWDGSASKTAELAQLTQSRYQVELQLAQQIHAALASTQAMFASTAEGMRYSTLDQAGQYDFLRQKSAGLEELLKSALDPAEIESLAQQLNDTSKAAWQLLGEEERKVKISEYEKYLAEIDALTTERLNASGATLGAERAADLPGSIVAAIESAMDRVSQQFMAAANAQQAAADTPITVTVDVNTPADVEVAYG